MRALSCFREWLAPVLLQPRDFRIQARRHQHGHGRRHDACKVFGPGRLGMESAIGTAPESISRVEEYLGSEVEVQMRTRAQTNNTHLQSDPVQVPVWLNLRTCLLTSHTGLLNLCSGHDTSTSIRKPCGDTVQHQRVISK